MFSFYDPIGQSAELSSDHLSWLILSSLGDHHIESSTFRIQFLWRVSLLIRRHGAAAWPFVTGYFHVRRSRANIIASCLIFWNHLIPTIDCFIAFFEVLCDPHNTHALHTACKFMAAHSLRAFRSSELLRSLVRSWHFISSPLSPIVWHIEYHCHAHLYGPPSRE